MTSPVGHTLGGYLVAGHCPGFGLKSMFGVALVWCLLVFSANAPDLDYIPGIWIGEFNRYHHQASHSIMFGLAYGLMIGLLVRLMFGMQQARSMALLATLAYQSHLLLDCVTADAAAPYGMQLFWPFSQNYVKAPFDLFLKIEHGQPTAELSSVFATIFSAHNCMAIGLELLCLGPVCLVLFLYRRHSLR